MRKRALQTESLPKISLPRSIRHVCRTLRTVRLTAIFLLFAVAVAGCHHSGPPVEREGADSLHLATASFDSRQFPPEFTCSGLNRSPELHWNEPPAGTRSLAMILYDRDAPGGSFVHWVLFNLPATTAALPPSMPALDQLPDGSRQGKNDFGQVGYGGPCPSGHSTHHYAFRLFALDTTLNLPAASTRAQLDDAMVGHVLARGELKVRFDR